MFCHPIFRELVRPSILAFRWSPSSLSPRKDGVLEGSSLSWCGRIDGEVKLWGGEVLVLFNRFCCCWLWDGELMVSSVSVVLSGGTGSLIVVLVSATVLVVPLVALMVEKGNGRLLAR